jgi:lipopolysaccharide/colanic/teichoic acid biosynthesis glycosyltransferase
MLWNLLKGDIKIVGIRPVGSHFLSLTDESYRSYRRHFKPGLLPPYYADLPSTFDEVIQSEKKYLGEYEKHPLKTDIKYFFKALKNIFVGRRQSQ